MSAYGNDIAEQRQQEISKRENDIKSENWISHSLLYRAHGLSTSKGFAIRDKFLKIE